MVPRTDSSCCCQARNLSWAPVPPPHAAARSRVCHGSLYGLPLLLSPSPHSAMCHFQVSSHCWWVPFCHRVLYGLPLLLPPPPPCAMCLSSAHAADGFRFLTEACVWLPNTAASTATLRHVPLSGLLTLLVGSIL
ncbi:unnamed protein product [Staurois parvus]|uniref:Uncharacterized protein n=1 Tax=Staurois parvus TaxID=386267 RepID=A0ABN9BTN4_9NEOB|nr:unnamed protein product [Staurois parvus]